MAINQNKGVVLIQVNPSYTICLNVRAWGAINTTP